MRSLTAPAIQTDEMERVGERVTALPSTTGLTFKFKDETVTLPWLGSTLAVDLKDGITVSGSHPSLPDTILTLRLCKGDAPAAEFVGMFADVSRIWFLANRADAAAVAVHTNNESSAEE